MTKAERQAREYGDEELIADEERAAHIAEYLQMSGWHRASVCVARWQADAAKLRAERQHAQTSTLPVHDAEAPRTVRVRIAVAVDEKGQYSAHGWWPRPLKDADVMARSQGCLVSRVTSCVWIEADIPLPATQTIRGEVVP